MRIALIVDNVYRDLPGLVLVAAELCRLGATCYLVPMNRQKREISALMPDVVLFNYLRPSNQQLISYLADAGMVIAVLDTEGGVVSDISIHKKILASDPAVRNLVSCYCLWGNTLAGLLPEQQLFHKEQLVVTGAPRFDFYTKLWNDCVRALPLPEGVVEPMVLINGNFPLANPRYPMTPKQERQLLVDTFRFEPSYVDQWQQIQEQALNGMCRLTERLARTFPRVHFVYRPHPFENIERYRQQIAKQNNIHIGKWGTVDRWIVRSAAVIQRSCSTGIEAAMAGIPSLSPTWIPVMTPLAESESVSFPCPTYELLEQNVRLSLQHHLSPTPNMKRSLSRTVKHWFGVSSRLDGKAYQRVASALWAQKKLTKQINKTLCQSLHFDVKEPSIPVPQRLSNRVKMMLRLGVNWSFRDLRYVRETSVKWDQPDKMFSADDVRGIIHALHQSGNLADGVCVRTALECGSYAFQYQGMSLVLCS